MKRKIITCLCVLLADLRRRVEADIAACHPVAVSILIGTNDACNGVPLDQYRGNLAAIIGHLTSAPQPGSR